MSILTVRHEPFPSISISTSSVSPTFFGLVGFFGLNISLKIALKTQFLVKTVFSSFRRSDPFRQNEVKKISIKLIFGESTVHLRISFKKSKGRDFQSRRFFLFRWEIYERMFDFFSRRPQSAPQSPDKRQV